MSVIKKLLIVVTSIAATVVLAGGMAYVWNAAPTLPAISTAEAANPTRPFIVKLHAQWCHVCLATKDVWSQVEATYAGRANLVVFDFTSEATTAAGRVEAKRLGLEEYFNENEGWSGAIVVLDGRTKSELAAVQGNQPFDEYREAIDKALDAVKRQGVYSPMRP